MFFMVPVLSTIMPALLPLNRSRDWVSFRDRKSSGIILFLYISVMYSSAWRVSGRNWVNFSWEEASSHFQEPLVLVKAFSIGFSVGPRL
ncbi:hypothetical protein D3C75_740130 [compost metagenome]